MKGLLSAAAVAAALVAGVTAASATSTTVGKSQPTIGELMASGQMSTAAVEELILHSGLTMDQAKNETIDQVVAKRWQNS